MLLVLLGVLLPTPSFADLAVEGKIPPFASPTTANNDGKMGELAAAVTDGGKPVENAVVLFEVYTTHGTDKGSHDAQMKEMEEILAGRKPAPAFRVDDVKLTGEPQRLVGASRGNGLYAAPFRFPYGRLFVKVTAIADGRPTVAPILYSTRIHCNQVNLDGFARQKEFLDHAREIVKRGNFTMLERAAAAMRKDLDAGHSMRFMIVHHEKDPRAYDDRLAALALAAKNKDPRTAAAALDRLDNAYAEALGIFLRVDLAPEQTVTTGRPASFRLRLYDPVNNHPLRTSLVVVQPEIDRAAETHAKAEGFHARLHAGHGGGDHSAHAHHHGPATPTAVPPGIVPRSNPDGSLTFSSTFEASGQKTLRLKLYYDGREFTHDLPVKVEPGPGKESGRVS
ncbi:MAG: hypothetical protein A2V83_10040 [Nitrospirae bacterium RBG_16_64_22]|nr:MAG: hypothetical protein A2V83_10040 [Nitrospirae bacterium RBG_16_64_22]